MSEATLADVFDAIEAAQLATDGATLIATMRPAFAKLGAQHFVWGRATAPGGERAPRADLGDPLEPWKRHYVEARLAVRDPLYPRALRRAAPFTWAAAQTDGPTTREDREVFEHARAFGLEDGFVTPVHHLNGSSAAVVLYSDRTLDWSPRETASAHMLSIYFAAVAARLSEAAPSAPSPTLSRRQRECLQWVRGGKTDWEIGQILGLSEHTVAEHLEAARRRLGVKTRAQAVIEAIARGLITV